MCIRDSPKTPKPLNEVINNAQRAIVVDGYNMIISEKMKSFHHRMRKNVFVDRLGLTSKARSENIYGNLNEDCVSPWYRKAPRRETLIRTPDKYGIATNVRNDYLRSSSTQNKLSENARTQECNVRSRKSAARKYALLLKKSTRMRRNRSLYKGRNWNDLQLLFNKKGREGFHSQPEIPQENSIFELKGMKIVIVRKENLLVNSELSKKCQPIKVEKVYARRIRASYKSCEQTRLPKSLTISEEFKISTKLHKPSGSLKGERASPYTSQVHFAPSGQVQSKMLLIIQFDGVVGNFNPSLFCQSQLLSFRANACSVLEALSKKYHIAILFKNTKEKAEFVLKHLGKQGVKVDGGYVVTQNPWNRLPVNYEEIYKDFEVESEEVSRKVIIVGSIDSEELPFNRSEAKFHEVISSVPVVLSKSSYKGVPLVVLVKNSRLDNSASSLLPLNDLLLNLPDSQIEYLKAKSDIWDIINTDEIQKQYVNEYMQKLLVKTNRKKNYRAVPKDLQDFKAIKDAQMNVKYIGLKICNENVWRYINEYYVAANSRSSSMKLGHPEIEVHRTISHRLIIIKEH
eukprot:TRINITY_DN7929_c0_g2_i17.p1 TRINITY_DN7929_c0_g2~~TRINITY_DN7929_c0_g2_i17.p1  ORF type:complete len:571 (+),score=96.48 TRINITY_DN7929_c0_g2_i17:87-1799(+)